MLLTPDEQDAMAANCPWCWAYPGYPCKTRSTGRLLKRPHRKRIRRARRRRLMDGVGRALLESWKRYGSSFARH